MRTLIRTTETKLENNKMRDDLYFMIDLETFKEDLFNNEYNEEQLTYIYNNNSNYYVKQLVANKLNKNISHSEEEKMARDNETLILDEVIVVAVKESIEYVLETSELNSNNEIEDEDFDLERSRELCEEYKICLKALEDSINNDIDERYNNENN